jgi:AraC-like DNA-binding protein
MGKSDPKVISTSYLEPLAIYCRAHTTRRLLANEESLLALANKRGQVTLKQFIDFTGLVIKATKNSGFAFDILPDTEISQHGLLGLAVLCGLNLKQALGILLKFYRLRSKLFNLKYKEENGRVIIQLEDCFDLAAADVFTHEITIGTLYKSKKDILGLQQSGCEIYFKHDKPDYAEKYSEFFDGPAHFNHSCSQISFPTEQLKLKLKLSNPETNKVLVSQCESELNQLPDETNIKLSVIERLKGHQTPLPSLNDMATLLHTSSRSLRRHLKEHQTSYQTLLDEEKMRRATQLLDNSELSITSIAHHLGYSDTANFSKAFKKLTGNPPKLYRESESGSDDTSAL